MTKAEKLLIKKALYLLHDKDDHYGCTEILAKLVGIESNYKKLTKNIKLVSPQDILRNNNFRCK